MKKNNILLLICDFIVLFILIIHYFVEIEILNFVVMMCYIAMLCIYIYYDANKVFLSLIYIFYFLLSLISLLLIEYLPNVYIYEIDDYSLYKNTFILYLFIIYCISRIILSGRYAAREQIDFDNYQIKYKYLFLTFVFTVLLISIFVIIKYKPAFLLYVDRFVYENDIIGSKMSKIMNLSIYSSLGLGMLFYRYKQKRYIYLLVVLLFIFICKGHKFGTLLNIIFIFITPSAIYVANNRLRKHLFYYVYLTVGLLVFTVVMNGLYTSNKQYDPIVYLEARLMQQSELWWSIKKVKVNSPMHIDEFKKEIGYILSISKDDNQLYETGIYKAMEVSTPNNIVRNKILSNSRYTNGLFPVLYYYFNDFLLVLFSLFLGLLFVYILHTVQYVIISGNLLLSIIAIRMLYLTQYFLTGDISKVFSYDMLICISIVQAYKFLYKNNRCVH